MKYKNMNFKEAFKLVYSKRFIRPNIGFIRQLIGKINFNLINFFKFVFLRI